MWDIDARGVISQVWEDLKKGDGTLIMKDAPSSTRPPGIGLFRRGIAYPNTAEDLAEAQKLWGELKPRHQRAGRLLLENGSPEQAAKATAGSSGALTASTINTYLRDIGKRWGISGERARFYAIMRVYGTLCQNSSERWSYDGERDS